MGTCGSKCCSCYPPIPPPPDYHSRRILPEKTKVVVLSKSPPPTLPVHGELISIKPDVTLTTTSSAPCSSSLTSTCSSASSSSTSVNYIYRPKENLEIVVLDPQKHGAGKPKAINRHPQGKVGQACKAVRAIPNQSFFDGVNKPFPAKRCRSSSPTTRTGRKSFRSANSPGCAAHPPPPTPPAPPRRNSSSPSPLRSSRSNVTNPIQRSRPLVEAPAENAVPARWRKENVRPLSSCISQGRRSSCMEKETFLHHIHHQVQKLQHRDMVDHSDNSREVFNNPLMDDLNNPLIAMDCFIFL